MENASDPTTVERVHWTTRKIAALDYSRDAVDLDAIVGNEATKSAVLFAFARIRSARSVAAGLRLHARDGARVWLNGTPMGGTSNRGLFGDGRAEAPIELHAGENTLLVKIAKDDGGWGFGVSIVDERGMPIELEWVE